MPEETTPRLMRYRLVETIVPLAASADELVDYVHADRSDIDEAVLDFAGGCWLPRQAQAVSGSAR